MTRKSRGFTLLEALAGLALFSLVTGVILAVFILAHRYYRSYEQVSQAHREAVLCMQGIGGQLVRAHQQTLQPASMVNATWFLSSRPPENSLIPVDFDPIDGQQLWQKWLAIWCDSQGEVRLSELPLPGGADSFLNLQLTPPSSLSVFSSLPRQHRLGSSIITLRFSQDGRLVNVDMLSRTSALGGPPTYLQLSSSFSTQ